MSLEIGFDMEVEHLIFFINELLGKMKHIPIKSQENIFGYYSGKYRNSPIILKYNIERKNKILSISVYHSDLKLINSIISVFSSIAAFTCRKLNLRIRDRFSFIYNISLLYPEMSYFKTGDYSIFTGFSFSPAKAIIVNAKNRDAEVSLFVSGNLKDELNDMKSSMEFLATLELFTLKTKLEALCALEISNILYAMFPLSEKIVSKEGMLGIYYVVYKNNFIIELFSIGDELYIKAYLSSSDFYKPLFLLIKELAQLKILEKTFKAKIGPKEFEKLLQYEYMLFPCKKIGKNRIIVVMNDIYHRNLAKFPEKYCFLEIY